jgi:CDP-glucose 4,6-dehydratase
VVADGADPLAQTRHDIATYVAEARAKSLAWAA